MNALDYAVLIGTMLGIALYGMWQTRGRRDLTGYLKGGGQTHWFVIGLSVMATQASAITFLSTPGQGFQDGLGFVQIYFGMPVALILIAAIFLPIFRRLGVFTAYEFLGKRFDAKTRLLGAGLFLLQRGLGAGLTIYAPAIVLSTMFDWPLEPTIIGSGLLVIIYTVAGGNDAVTLTQKYQIAIIFAGMIAAAVLVLLKLPAGLTWSDTLTLAGGFHKLRAVNFSTDPHERYTIWSGLLGGTFLMLSYFGADQSQVQRYISGASLRESRLGLMFNAVCKIPMQFCILSLGVLVFVFYQFEPQPLFFNQSSGQALQAHAAGQSEQLKAQFATTQLEKERQLRQWLDARHSGNRAGAAEAFAAASAADGRGENVRRQAEQDLLAADPRQKTNEADYIFITFILRYLPHGVIGLLVAAFFAAALSSKAAELNALGTTTTVDFYRHLIKRDATDAHCVVASKWFTAFWGIFAIGFALYGHLSENLIQAVNILGSIFYGVILGLFVVAFFIRRVGGTAIFWGAVAAQALVFILYFNLTISYLWFPLIGCAACVIFSLVLQAWSGPGGRNLNAPAT
ncbi:MAG TPA: sodium:solute symporter [Verrucomicrobiae bacterium]|nr:sodium:solute symporter [Verrucomicrobiae bacterium]